MAVIYIIFALITAMIFILTRDVFLTVEKREFLSIKVDLTFFAVVLYNTDKSEKQGIKSKADGKKHRDIPFIYKQIKRLLAFCDVKILRLYLPVFEDGSEPSHLPKTLGNSALGFCIAAFIKSLARRVTVADGAMLPDPDSFTVYHLMLKAPLYRILYTVSAIRLNKLKSKVG